MIIARNPFRRLRYLQEIPKSSSSESSKSIQGANAGAPGTNASPSQFHIIPATRCGGDSQCFTLLDAKRKFRAQISKSIETVNVDYDSSEDDNVELADVLQRKFDTTTTTVSKPSMGESSKKPRLTKMYTVKELYH